MGSRARVLAALHDDVRLTTRRAPPRPWRFGLQIDVINAAERPRPGIPRQIQVDDGVSVGECG